MSSRNRGQFSEGDNDRVATVASVKTLLELFSNDTTAISGDFEPLNREYEAELFALETLFPVEFRQDYLEEPPKPSEYMVLAERFRIPLDYARLGCQPNYVRSATTLRGGLLKF